MNFEELLDKFNTGRYDEVIKNAEVKATDPHFALLKARALEKKGQYIPALEIIKNYESSNDHIRFHALVIKCRILSRLGEFDEAKSLCEQILKSIPEGLDEDLVSQTYIILGNLLRYKGELDQSLDKYEKSLSIGTEINHKGSIATSLNNIGIVHWLKGDLAKGLDYFKQSLSMRETVGNRYEIASSLNNIANIYADQGELDQAIKYYQRSNSIQQEIGNEHNIATLLNNIGSIYEEKGEFDLARQHFQESLEIRKKVGNEQDIAVSYLNLGNIDAAQSDFVSAIRYYQRGLSIQEEIGNRKDLAATQNNIGLIYKNSGDFEAALDYFNMSLANYQEIGNQADIASLLNNVGTIYKSKGELTKALEYFYRSLKIKREQGNKIQIASTLTNLGNVQEERGEISQSLTYYQESLTIREEIGNKANIAQILVNLGSVYQKLGHKTKSIELYNRSIRLFRDVGDRIGETKGIYHIIKLQIDLGLITEARKNLEKFKMRASQLDNKLVDQYCKLSQSIVLGASDLIKDKGLSMIKLEELIGDDDTDQSIKVSAMMNRFELQILELEYSRNPNIFKTIERDLDELNKYATDQRLVPLQVRILLVLSRIFTLKGSVEKSKKTLGDAKKMADDQGLMHLSIKASNEFDKLLERLDLVNEDRITDSSSPLLFTDIEDYVINVFRNPLHAEKLKREQPGHFLIVGESGEKLYSKLLEPKYAKDSDLLAGFIKAIDLFLDEKFSSSGRLETIKFNNFKIQVKKRGMLIFCYIYQGYSFSAQLNLERVVDLIWLNPSIADFLGSKDKSNFANWSFVDDILNDIFISDLSKIEDYSPEQSYSFDSSNLKSFKQLIAPVRLGIVMILEQYFRIERANLQKLLGVSSGILKNNLDKLSDMELIEEDYAFIDEKPRKVIVITEKGRKHYTEFKRYFLGAKTDSPVY